MKHQGTPDHHSTDRCAPASPLDAAQVLEDAADLLLIRGRCRDAGRGYDGSMCVVAALVHARVGDYGPAKRAVEAHLKAQGSPECLLVFWNQSIEDDDVVRDTLLLVAKDLRNTAVPA